MVVKKKRGSQRSHTKKQVFVPPHHFRVVIFGSARISSGDKHYKSVYKLAKMIGKEGMDVVTGGGPGLMDAASRGHHEGRGANHADSIGLLISLPHEQKEGFHIDIKRHFSRFSGRLDQFMELSHVVVVAPGGVGTLLEFVYTWQLLQVKQMSNVPLILMGSMWREFLVWVKKNLLKSRMISKKDLDFIHCVNTPQEAMEIILKARADSKNGKVPISYGRKKL